MKRIDFKLFSIAASLMIICGGCSNNDQNGEPFGPGGGGDSPMPGPGGQTVDDTDAPNFDNVIYPYEGQKATDSKDDIVGTDADFYHEANDFTTVVNVTYNGDNATVDCGSGKVISHVSGAHVVIDLLTNSVKNVNIVLKGSTNDGSLKVYGEKKFLLTLNGVDITSQRGPAINSQCKKRMFVDIKEGTENSLKDCAKYQDDTYYLEGKTADDEDRKGCFFSEGHMIFSGYGVLTVAGLKKHGIVTDGYFWMRPGVTIAVTEAAKNAVHVKGDEEDGIGVTINGGLLYTNVSSDAGKGIKTDLMVNINGGQLLLNTSGKSIYEEEEADTSSPACIKADGDINIAGGELTLKSTGTGGKGLSADAAINISGGTTTITTTGGKYIYTDDLTSSPKGIKADGDVNITGGKLNICVTGKSDGSEGLESKANMTISNGEVYIYAYDDAINAANSIVINGGSVFAHSVANDAIDSNGTLTINGGTVVASGTNAPDGSFDADFSQNFIVNGGTLIGIGGVCTTPSNNSKQNCLLYGGLEAAKGTTIDVVDSSGNKVGAYQLHRTLTGLVLFYSSPKLTKGSYTIDCNNTKIGEFTVSDVITSVGYSGDGQGGGPGGGGQPGEPGGNQPGQPGGQPGEGPGGQPGGQPGEPPSGDPGQGGPQGNG